MEVFTGIGVIVVYQGLGVGDGRWMVLFGSGWLVVQPRHRGRDVPNLEADVGECKRRSA